MPNMVCLSGSGLHAGMSYDTSRPMGNEPHFVRPAHSLQLELYFCNQVAQVPSGKVHLVSPRTLTVRTLNQAIASRDPSSIIHRAVRRHMFWAALPTMVRMVCSVVRLRALKRPQNTDYTRDIGVHFAGASWQCAFSKGNDNSRYAIRRALPTLRARVYSLCTLTVVYGTGSGRETHTAVQSSARRLPGCGQHALATHWPRGVRACTL